MLANFKMRGVINICWQIEVWLKFGESKKHTALSPSYIDNFNIVTTVIIEFNR